MNERYTHYPVPSDVKASKELERTFRVDLFLYSHATRPLSHEQLEKHRINVSDHVRHKSIASEKRNPGE